MSSLSRRYRSGRPEAVEFMPPNLPAIGAVPFGDLQRARLSAWLREGAWLPPIWGERCWKVPTKISTRSQYDEFIALIVGFMQHLDRELSGQSSRFESSVLRRLRGREHAEALRGWGRGFMTALTLGSQGLKSRGASAGAAIRTIASSTSSCASLGAGDEVVSAVLSLMEQRGSRGPLGALEAKMPIDSTAYDPDAQTFRPARVRD